MMSLALNYKARVGNGIPGAGGDSFSKRHLVAGREGLKNVSIVENGFNADVVSTKMYEVELS